MKTLLLFLCFSLNSYAQRTPIVFVHGFLASGDTWNTQIQRFLQSGYSKKELQVFDWNTVNGKNQDSLLGLFIDSVLVLNKAQKVNLIGHSAGGSLSYKLTKNINYSNKIGAYVHIGSSPIKNAAGIRNEIPTYILYSSADYVAKNNKAIDTSKGLDLKDKDHYEVATSEATFKELFLFFNKYKPINVDELKLERLCWVRNIFFGTNEALPNSEAVIQQYSPTTGIFLPSQKTVISNDLGWWTMPINRKDKNNYTISLQPTKDSRKVIYFFEKITDSKLISLRAFNTHSMIGLLLAQLPKDSIQPAICIFTSNKSTIAGRDTLSINGIPLSSTNLTPANKTIIATFVYDDGDKITTGTKHKALAAAPFMNGIDVFIAVQKNKSISIQYNHRTVIIPTIASKDAITVVVLE